jgi:hypothetical protein
MNHKVGAILILIIIASITVVVNFNMALADEDFCYDQSGDGHFCFHQRDSCKFHEKHD